MKSDVAVVVDSVGVGVGFGRSLLINATCAAICWHASIPVGYFSALLAACWWALRKLARRLPAAAIVRRLPDIVFFCLAA